MFAAPYCYCFIMSLSSPYLILSGEFWNSLKCGILFSAEEQQYLLGL